MICNVQFHFIIYFRRPADEELPDSFYDFTPEDYARVTSAATRTTNRAEGGLRTRKLRDAEQNARAQRFGPVCNGRYLSFRTMRSTLYIADVEEGYTMDVHAY